MKQGRESAATNGGFLRYLAAWGPGIATVLTWLGAGDIVAGMVAGSEFGYTLLWAMALTVVLRSVLASSMAKYQIVNPRGESIIGGLSRLGKWLPWFLFLYIPLFNFLTNLATLKACVDVWHQVIPQLSTEIWGFFWALLAFSLVITGSYARVERSLKIILGVLSTALIICVTQTDIDFSALASGLLTPQVPAHLGHRNAFLVLLGILGGVGGSVATLSYAYFVREKGWTRPEHRKLQIYDISFSAVVMVLLNLLVWILAVEVIGPLKIKVTTAEQMAQTLAQTLGSTGELLFYLGLWAAAFSTLVGVTLGSGYLMTDIWYSRLKRSGPVQHRSAEGVPYLISVFTGTLLPLLALVSDMDFVSMSLLSNAYTTILVPILIFGTLIITNRADWIGREFKNSKLLNVALTAMGLYSVYLLVRWVSGLLEVRLPA